ncbi:MAG TPA: DUF4835 family protein [Bacteroidales bacterium]|nr:DUF4835 family protein [Bacteroidales bacterium]HOR82587.1 DUF4835 family protein [Bacteroidales bacterium]HPJ91988.1 DUF4835 family protein [Bacteroidales bacterium]HQB19249.1 DUF4835 family protein [Bacteroidales bacterium]
MKRLIVSLFLTISFIACFSQEFKARVSVNTQKLQGADKTPFTALEQELNSFVNERKWTNYNFKSEEKIECNIQLSIEEIVSAGKYNARLLVQLSRPVFNSSYLSSLFAFQDNGVSFTYTLNQPLDYDNNSFQHPLTAIVGFYLNLFLGLTFDSFSQSGGTPYYSQCQTILNYSQANSVGWDPKEKKNRYWLIENISNPSNQVIRDFYYKYHRLGLDIMHKDIDGALDNILQALEELKQFNQSKSGVMMFSLIFTAKSDELVNVFSGASEEKRHQAYELLKQMDPLNESKYSKLTK